MMSVIDCLIALVVAAIIVACVAVYEIGQRMDLKNFNDFWDN